MGKKGAYSRDDRWNDNFNTCLNYFNKTGKLPISTDKENGGLWLVKQRSNFKFGKLEREKELFLDDNLPGWNLSVLTRKSNDYVAKWNHMLEKVVNYYDKYGVFPIAKDRKNGGAWLVIQRNMYINNSLDFVYVDKLNNELAGWNIDVSEHDFEMINWYRHLLIVKNYYLEHGIYPSSKQELSCGSFILGQRNMYLRGTLEEEKLMILNKELPGWKDFINNEVVDLETNWENYLNVVFNFYKENKKFPNGYDRENGGAWLASQRYGYRYGLLSPSRKKKLDSLIPGWFVNNNKFVKDSLNWEKCFQLVKAYYEKEGYLPMVQDIKNGGDWLSRQRSSYKLGNLSLEKIKILTDAFGNWERGKIRRGLNQDMWMSSFEKFKNYYLEHNDLPIVSDVEHGGAWLSSQRHFYRIGKLSEDRIAILDGLCPNWKMTPQRDLKVDDDAWLKKLSLVKEYYSINKDFPKKQDIINGGDWLYRQYRYLMTGVLKEYRKEILDKELPNWNVKSNRGRKRKVVKIENSDNFLIVNKNVRVRKD